VNGTHSEKSEIDAIQETNCKAAPRDVLNGKGFPELLIEKLARGDVKPGQFSLFVVHKRAPVYP
jgi:hypothetical protein